MLLVSCLAYDFFNWFHRLEASALPPAIAETLYVCSVLTEKVKETLKLFDLPQQSEEKEEKQAFGDDSSELNQSEMRDRFEILINGVLVKCQCEHTNVICQHEKYLRQTMQRISQEFFLLVHTFSRSIKDLSRISEAEDRRHQQSLIEEQIRKASALLQDLKKVTAEFLIFDRQKLNSSLLVSKGSFIDDEQSEKSRDALGRYSSRSLLTEKLKGCSEKREELEDDTISFKGKGQYIIKKQWSLKKSLNPKSNQNESVSLVSNFLASQSSPIKLDSPVRQKVRVNRKISSSVLLQEEMNIDRSFPPESSENHEESHCSRCLIY